MLESLNIYFNRSLKIIHKDAFSNLHNLKELFLNYSEVSKLDPELFACLSNLEKLDLECNNLRSFDLKILEYIVNIKEILIDHNNILNIQELLNRFKKI